MNIIRSTYGSIKQTYNSINPATLSGAIDVIVVEHEDGTLACSPFHVRFGKYQILRPSDKKVEFTVNDRKQALPMKLGEAGEAFFVFETTERIPLDLQTSPLVSPETSPQPLPTTTEAATPALQLPEPEPLDLATDTDRHGRARSVSPSNAIDRAPLSLDRSPTDPNALAITGQASAAPFSQRPKSGDWSGLTNPRDATTRSFTDDTLTERRESLVRHLEMAQSEEALPFKEGHGQQQDEPTREAVLRATALSKRLWTANIASKITAEGDLMLDNTPMDNTDAEEHAIKVEAMARKILTEELSEEEGGHNYNIGSRIGLDEQGNIWVYHSEAAKATADRRAGLQAMKYSQAIRSFDAISDPGYHSDEEGGGGGGGGGSERGGEHDQEHRYRRDSDSALGTSMPPDSPSYDEGNREPKKSYAKTLRLTSEQLKQLDLKPGANPMTFTVNKSTCPANLYLWRHDNPIVISDIDGTITKSDALGHLFNAIGRDWTHLGVAKLYTDIANNGYNLIYLTSRSVGLADKTRNYLSGVIQEGYKLPRGAVVMSPDRTYAALRREVYLRKPEVFKMACLRDIMSLFQTPDSGNGSGGWGSGQGGLRTPFYAGFGNRITDAMSYRSVSIPSQRIFTINSNAEVSMYLLASDQYRTSYVTMRELVDHYFPPVGLLVKEGGEEYTDFNYWRDRPLEIDEFSASESGDESEYQESQYQPDGRPSIDTSVRSEAGQTEAEDMENSFYSRASLESRQGYEEAFDPSLESSILEEADDDDDDNEDENDEMLSFPPETPFSERHFQLGDEYRDPSNGRKIEFGAGEGVEFDVEDESGNLAGLDLASEATPHVGPVDAGDGGLGGGLRPVEELGRVLSSPERRRRREVD